MKKPEINSKLIFTVAGAVVAVSSILTIADFFDRKRREKVAHVGELIAGVAGLALSAALATEPKRLERREELVIDDMFTDEDAVLAHEQIREALSSESDRGTQSKGHLRTIEVDNDTSIEDFIFD